MKTKLHIKYAILILVCIAIILALILYGPIPQPLSYHNFADQRRWLYIPNFANVVSNVFFILIGLFGLYFVLQPSRKLTQTFMIHYERVCYVTFFIGIFLLGFGSGYYHWQPDNTTLVWDRLSIAIAAESFLAAMLAERINLRFGFYLLVPLLILGIASVGYWHYTERFGQGDLRFYIAMQFSPIILTILLLLLFKPLYSNQFYIWLAIAAYIIAKICEHSDQWFYQQLHHTLSGHTIKHLFAALSCYFILVYLRSRRPILWKKNTMP